jgi:hypothetical protein
LIVIEGRIAPSLDEFMLRLGHLSVLAHLASSLEGRPRRLEKELADFLTRPVKVENDKNQQIAAYLSSKRLCHEEHEEVREENRRRKFRYPELETWQDSGDSPKNIRIRALKGGPVVVWWQDYCLSDPKLQSAVGAVTVGGRVGSSTGVSHLLDWGVILGLLNRDLSASAEARLMSWLQSNRADTTDWNPFLLSSEDRTILAYILLRADLDVFVRFAAKLIQAAQPVRKADGSKLFGSVIESLIGDAEINKNVSHRAQSIVYEQFKELKRAQRRKTDEPLGSSSTAWHRSSSRLESYVDLGLLSKKSDTEILRFEYAYFSTELLRRIYESISAAASGVEWLEGPFIDFFGAVGKSVERFDRISLRNLLAPITKALGRPIRLFPLDALALGLAVSAPSLGFSISVGNARQSLENLAREHPESARLSRGTIGTRAEFISLDLEKL